MQDDVALLHVSHEVIYVAAFPAMLWGPEHLAESVLSGLTTRPPIYNCFLYPEAGLLDRSMILPPKTISGPILVIGGCGAEKWDKVRRERAPKPPPVNGRFSRSKLPHDLPGLGHNLIRVEPLFDSHLP